MSNDALSINPDAVRQLASQITTKAHQAQANHGQAWNRLQGHLEEYPAPLHNLLFSVLNSHQQRMGHSYQWQLSFASALSDSADAFEQMDAAIGDLFSS